MYRILKVSTSNLTKTKNLFLLSNNKYTKSCYQLNKIINDNILILTPLTLHLRRRLLPVTIII